MTENLSKPVSAVMILDDPHEKHPVSIYAEKGGTLEWRTDSLNYPEFEIQFVGESPARASDKLTGTTKNPVVVHVTKSGKYRYNVRHVKKDGTDITTGIFAARSCFPC
jgi:hypothetical protein